MAPPKDVKQRKSAFKPAEPIQPKKLKTSPRGAVKEIPTPSRDLVNQKIKDWRKYISQAEKAEKLLRTAKTQWEQSKKARKDYESGQTKTSNNQTGRPSLHEQCALCPPADVVMPYLQP